MEPGTNPNPNPFDPNQYQPARPRVKRSHWTVIILILVVLVFGGGWLIVQRVKRSLGWFHNNIPGVTSGNYGGKRFDTVYRQPFDPSVRAAKLTLNGGTCIYELRDTTNQLLRADAMLFHSRYALTSNKTDSAYEMSLTMKSKSKTNFGHQSDSVNLKLNPAPVWDINVNTGAAELNFDLSKFKLRTLKIAATAGAFTIKLGQPLAETKVSAATTGADITVNIPKNAAFRIEKHAALSSDNFDGLSKKSDGAYESDGFQSAKNKIVILFSGSISDFKVNRY